MVYFQQYKGSHVEVSISGNQRLFGLLVDEGLDIIVLYDGNKYIYLPTTHIHQLQNVQNTTDDALITMPETPYEVEEDISYRKILNNAKGRFVEILVTGKQPIHGIIMNVLTNYFVFYSPIYKTMYIPLFHLKWLIPFQKAPYSLEKILLPVTTPELTLSRTIEEQLKKLEGNIVIFDLGVNENKIGLLKKIENEWAILVTADEKTIYCNIPHIKTVHSPIF